MDREYPDHQPADPRIEFFNQHASGWDSHAPTAEEKIQRLDQLSGLLCLGRGQQLLEVGCGTGKLTAYLAAQVAPGRVCAIDFAPAMIQAARSKNIDAEFICADVCGYDLSSGRYDIVFCFHCFPHFRDKASALSNMAQSLKPTGRLIVMHLAGSEHINTFHTDVGGAVGEDYLPVGDEWPPLLAAAGLSQKTLVDREDLFFMEAGRPAE